MEAIKDKVKERPILHFLVTGTFHGSYVYAVSEGQARRIFHAHYNGESITHISEAAKPWNL